MMDLLCHAKLAKPLYCQIAQEGLSQVTRSRSFMPIDEQLNVLWHVLYCIGVTSIPLVFALTTYLNDLDWATSFTCPFYTFSSTTGPNDAISQSVRLLSVLATVISVSPDGNRRG